MARASGIWVVNKGSFTIGAFTVKRELKRWLEKNKAKYSWSEHEINIVRCQDGNPDLANEYYSMGKILNG